MNAPTVTKHQTYLTILGTYTAILGTILGLFFAKCELRIAQNEAERARRAEAVDYTLEAVDTGNRYAIWGEGVELDLQAPSLRIRVTHGSLRTITAIAFDGTTFHEMSGIPLNGSRELCEIEITMPAYTTIVHEGTVYDYFFLLLEPVEGVGRLDLICNTIQLDTNTVQSSVFHPAALAQVEFLPEGPEQEMLRVYGILWRELRELGMI